MGKTTLARKVFNDGLDSDHLFESMFRENPFNTNHFRNGVQNMEAILKKLQATLNAQNYLLVLDGI